MQVMSPNLTERCPCLHSRSRSSKTRIRSFPLQAGRLGWGLTANSQHSVFIADLYCPLPLTGRAGER